MLNRLLILLLLTCPASAHAALTIQGTRIIYEEVRGEATVHMQYTGDAPTLLQMWLDSGDEDIAPGTEDIAFILTPAVVRVDPGHGQTVRVLRVGEEGLAQDRETVLYFNTLEVPPAPNAQLEAGEPFMQFSIRGRFKFFYRPKGLPVSPEQAHAMLGFAIAGPLPDGRLQVRISNPSPYHVTFSTLNLREAGAPESDLPQLAFDHETPSGRMVPPLGELLLPLEWGALMPGSDIPEGLEVHYSIINDAGGIQPGQGRVQ